MAATKARFLLLLRLRYSSPLFRLPSAAHIHNQLHFLNTGPQQANLPAPICSTPRSFHLALTERIIHFIEILLAACPSCMCCINVLMHTVALRWPISPRNVHIVCWCVEL